MIFGNVLEPVRRLFAPTTPDQVLSGSRTRSTYTQTRQNPLAAYFGRLVNPDPTLAKHGTWEGLELYARIRRQITELGGIVAQLVDIALKRPPTIVPGDLSDGESVRIADNYRRIWDEIPEKAIVLRKTIDNLITFGFAPIEMVWSRDPQTMIVAATKLIDRPPRNFIFDVDEQPRFISILDPLVGEPIDPLKFLLLRAGTTNTPYGESAFTELYSAAWLYQEVQKFWLDSVEKYGRPVPHIHIPRTYTAADVADLDNFYTAKFGTYTRGLWDGNEVKVEYPAMPMASAGAAGRSELDSLRFLQAKMYIRLLRTQQTQDKTSGSRSLETVRDSRTEAAAATYSDILCEGLDRGWLAPSVEINFPSLDPMLRPRVLPDPMAFADLDKMHMRLMNGIDRGILYSKRDYFRRVGMQEAKDDADVLGHPQMRITDSGPGITPPPPTDPNLDDATDDTQDVEDLQDGGTDENQENPNQ